MRINELETHSGLDRATIRYYEREGLIVPKRSENNYRDYTDEDLMDLRKIKLLRQIGLSLDKIKVLKSGAEDFSAVMAQQIKELNKEILNNIQARSVCSKILEAGVTYSTLNPEEYLEIFEAKPEKVPAWAPRMKQEFREDVPIEAHPFRRYFARMFDYFGFSVLIFALIFLVFRVRSFHYIVCAELLGVLLWVSYYLWVPIEALWLTLIGTTPGKWLMGIQVRSEYGGKLLYSAALYRSWRALSNGMGFNLPIISIICMVKGYENLKNGIQPSWDDESELFYDWKKPANILKYIAANVLSLILLFWSFFDIMLPMNRGGELSLTQFAENYNNYVKVYGTGQLFDQMDENGQWREQKGIAYSNSIGENTLDRKPERFEYVLQDDRINVVKYFKYFHYIEHYDHYYFPDESAYAVYALAGGQRRVDVFSYNDFQLKVQTTKLADNAHGQLNYKNVTVQWRSWVESYDVIVNGEFVETIQRICFEATITQG